MSIVMATFPNIVGSFLSTFFFSSPLPPRYHEPKCCVYTSDNGRNGRVRTRTQATCGSRSRYSTEHKYYSEIGSSHDTRFAPPIQSKQSENHYMENRGSNYPILAQPDDAKSKRRPSVIWVLAFVAVIGIAVALGAGLGVGLAGQHESNSPV